MKAIHTRKAKPQVAQVVGWMSFGAMVTIAVAWVVALDLFVAAAWIHPIGWALALAPVTLLLLVSLTALDRTKPKAKWVSLGAFLLSVLVVLVPWNPRKRFVNDLFTVRPGMSVDEVEAVMAGYIRGTGAKWHVPQGPAPSVRGPEDPQDTAATARARAAFDTHREPDYPAGQARLHVTGTITYRWSTDVKYDADWGQVEFVDGKVVKVEFLPD
jgi:hypothetical protein